MSFDKQSTFFTMSAKPEHTAYVFLPQHVKQAEAQEKLSEPTDTRGFASLILSVCQKLTCMMVRISEPNVQVLHTW